MRFRGFFCAAVMAMAVLTMTESVSAQQSGQAGTGTTSGSTGSTNVGNANANAGANTSNNSDNPADRGIRSRLNTNPNNQNPIQRQQSLLMISGKVVLDNGAPAPMGTIIIRDCGGKITREVNVGPDGGFGFQVGGNNSLLPDASDNTPTIFGGATRSSSYFTFPDEAMGSASRLAGCELRAQIGGYRSSALMLSAFQGMGIIDAGTIVLYPTTMTSGTMVSVTNLSAPRNARKALEQAEKAYQKKNLDAAEKYDQIALKVYPRYASAWCQLGLIYSQSHRIEEARSAFSKALEADGKYVNPLVGLARLALAESNWREAALLTDRALELDPLDFPDGYYINALANYNLNQMDAAERSARKLERLDGPHQWPQVHLIMAGILHRRKDVSGETEELRSYLKQAPQSSIQGEIRTRIHDLENGGK
jgi:hypothetical protein